MLLGLAAALELAVALGLAGVLGLGDVPDPTFGPGDGAGPGPTLGGRRRCPLLDEQRCPLLGGADVVVVSSTTPPEVLDGIGRLHPEAALCRPHGSDLTASVQAIVPSVPGA